MSRRAAVPRAAALGLAALACAACALGAGGAASDTATATATARTQPARGSSRVLTGDQLRATGSANLWDALRQLRPEWLRGRAAASLISGEGDEPVVYLHGIHHGPVRTMQQMNIEQVRRVEFVDGRDATTRFGTGHGGGVIMVDLDRS